MCLWSLLDSVMAMSVVATPMVTAIKPGGPVSKADKGTTRLLKQDPRGAAIRMCKGRQNATPFVISR